MHVWVGAARYPMVAFAFLGLADIRRQRKREGENKKRSRCYSSSVQSAPATATLFLLFGGCWPCAEHGLNLLRLEIGWRRLVSFPKVQISAVCLSSFVPVLPKPPCFWRTPQGGAHSHVRLFFFFPPASTQQSVGRLVEGIGRGPLESLFLLSRWN